MPRKSVPQTVRICKVCNIEFPATTEYFRRRLGRDKKEYLDTICITCRKTIEKEKRKLNPEIERERQRVYRNKPEVKAKHAADMRVWRKEKAELAREIDRRSKKKRRQANPDAINSRMREWYHENHDSRRKYANQWRNDNKIKVKAYEHKRRSQKKTSVIEEITPDDIERLFKQSKGRCWWCGKKVKRGNFHLDHRIPLSRGGGHTLGNIVISCVKCNTSKSDKLPHEWSDRLL